MPVQRAALGSGGAIGIHEVHAVLTDEADQGLGKFFDGFVKGFAGGMSMFAKDVVLSFHHTRQSADQNAAFPCQVAVNFILERGREQIARADGNPQSNRAFICMACMILMNCKTGVDSAASEEVAADACAGALRATRATSTCGGGITPVSSLNVTENRARNTACRFIQTFNDLRPL